jgi:hypothetical protein
LFSAGFSRVCISPPVGVPLAGYAARQGVSEGIHDDLFARALVLVNESTAIVFVSVDLLALPTDFVQRVRARVQESTGITAEVIMIASTHTHAGPVTIRTFFNPHQEVDKEYMDSLAAAIEECIVAAWRSRFRARVGVGTGCVMGIGVNRRSADYRPIDEEVGVIKVEDEQGRTRAVLVNYACHPTVLGLDNLLVTGDFPNFAVKRIEEALGPDGFGMFVNGTQGNISMGHSSELTAIGVVTPGRTFQRAAELGDRLANAALEVLPSIETNHTVSLKIANVLLSLPLKKLPSVKETTAALSEAEARLKYLTEGADIAADPQLLARAKTEHLYASITDFYAREAARWPDGFLPVELHGARVDDAVFVAVPGEVFVEIGLRLKSVAPHRTFILGITNGYIGYMPTREAYDAGGYEVVSAKCDRDSEDLLIEKVIELEEILFTDSEPVNDMD